MACKFLYNFNQWECYYLEQCLSCLIIHHHKLNTVASIPGLHYTRCSALLNNNNSDSPPQPPDIFHLPCVPSIFTTDKFYY